MILMGLHFAQVAPRFIPYESPSNGRPVIYTRLSNASMVLHRAWHPCKPPASSILILQTVYHALICPSVHCFNARPVSIEFDEERPMLLPSRDAQ